MLINIALSILGLWIGLTFADVDLAPVLPIRHRSAWTHGPLVPLIVVSLIGVLPFYLVAAFLVGNTIHLARDLFPKAWTGGALIKLHPLAITLPPPLSFAWIFLGVYLSAVSLLDIL